MSIAGPPTTTAPFGHLPALDGIRAFAVLAVIGYHLGWGWLGGGFLGVEVFFVVSGYLITSLLLHEHLSTGRVNVRTFWIRRSRRLLPALGLMMVGVSMWALLFADPTAAALRRDVVPALLYVSNWWQIFGVDEPYFAPADPPLLRHLWSLGVEEQWYLIWPFAFLALFRATSGQRRRSAGIVAIVAVAIMVLTAVASVGASGDRVNLLYLSSVTRSSGLLIGAAAALVWRPWQGRHQRVPTRVLEVAGLVAFGVIAVAMTTLTVSGMPLYRGGLALVTVASMVLIAAAIHPGSGRLGLVFSHPALVAVGRRSYGLYLWHWPIIVFSDARASTSGTLTAAAVTVVVAEVSYRLVETPLRRGALGAWWASLQARRGAGNGRTIAVSAAVAMSSVFLLTTIVIGLSRAETVDPSLDTASEVVWQVPVAQPAVSTTLPPVDITTPVTDPVVPVVSVVPVVMPDQPVSMVVVGDSQAGSLARNIPTGLETLFTVSDGSIEGCGIYDSGVAVSLRRGFQRAFAECEGWSQRWADQAIRAEAQVALVMIGAWEVLDLDWESTSLPVGAPRTDVHFLRQAQQGIDALTQVGVKVALLEVACMRPVDAAGAGVPPLPERGDDARVAHVNQLLRTLAERNSDTTIFVSGPVEWCSGSAVSVDTAYRWDGVHVYKPGVSLIFDAIAGRLLQFAAA